MTRGGLPSDDPFGPVSRTERRGSFFSGVEQLAPPEAIAAWLRRAAAGDEFIYCEAREPLRGEGWVRISDLARDGLVRTHERKRAGGGKVYYAVRTAKGLPARPDPASAALAEPATDLIFRALKRAANLGQPCPGDTDLMRLAGLTMRQQAGNRFRKLIDASLIRSELIYERGVARRVVTILPGKHAGGAAGRSTAPPASWAALRRSAEQELRAADDVDMKRLREAGL